MPTMKVVDMAGKEVGKIKLSDAVFGQEVRSDILHTAVRAYLLNQRQGTQSTLTRTEVSGGGKKPWRQKGTGHARQGSTRAPQWTHGGVALGPKPRSYRVNLDKRTKRAALISALSGKCAAKELVIVDAVKLDDYSTKTMVGMFAALAADKKPMLVLDSIDEVVIKSCANVPGAKVSHFFGAENEVGEKTVCSDVNVYDILNSGKLILTRAAAEKIQEVYGK